jgi:hypothetical protein
MVDALRIRGGDELRLSMRLLLDVTLGSLPVCAGVIESATVW